MIPPKYKTSRKIPRQVRKEIDLEISESLGELMSATALVTTAVVVVTVPLSLNLISQLALKRLLDTFKTLQIVVHIMLIDMFAVAHSEIFFRYLLQISNF